MQALNAWLAGHDAGVLLQGIEPDGPAPLTDGVVVAQRPAPGSVVHRWDVITVWLRGEPGDGAGDREPREPSPPVGALSRELPGEIPDRPGYPPTRPPS
ncbi:serine/threonine kinase [Spongiactinospora rosea]|uniref:Serine/threonine kinase n=2 Tax=Spongiactinospora rosea TaxID=2248750 RepID=A0A366LKN4_9ACTN|nr:serine/threonine kinase [Spongiactinospora rosea]